MGRELLEQGHALQRNGQFVASSECFNQAFRLGIQRAAAELSWMLLFGRRGIPRDRAKARQLAATGAKLGCAHCLGSLSCTVLLEDSALSLQLARDSAAAGCSYGHYVIGRFYRDGIGGVEQDLTLAKEHYQNAAAQGLAEAQCSLGLMYQQGCGVPQNYEDALRWYKLAAAQGQPKALHAIGALYERGLGVAASASNAVSWFKLAAEAGEYASQEALRRFNMLYSGLCTARGEMQGPVL